jgi:hypothetical protein
MTARSAGDDITRPIDHRLPGSSNPVSNKAPLVDVKLASHVVTDRAVLAPLVDRQH